MNLDEKIPLAGQVTKQLVRDAGEEVADIPWCGPALCAVVDDDGKEGRVLAAGAEILAVESQEDADGCSPSCGAPCGGRWWTGNSSRTSR